LASSLSGLVTRLPSPVRGTKFNPNESPTPPYVATSMCVCSSGNTLPVRVTLLV
jgi:hypothetical protein